MKNLFDLANFIKKADDDDAPPKPEAKKPEVSKGNGNVIPSIGVKKVILPNSAPEVKTMQEAIRSFAATVTNYSQSSSPQQKSQADQGKKSFNDFITENFVSENSKGQEWTTDKKVTAIPDKQKTQTNLYEQHVVVDGWQRIGMPKAEVTPDGVWGPRSQMALKNIAAFAKALVEVEKRFTGKESVDFSSGNVAYLEAVSEFDPKKDFQSNGKTTVVVHGKVGKGRTIGAVAQATAATIRALEKYYKIFLQKTLTNPKNAIFIQEDKPLDSVKKKEPKQNLEEADKQLLAQVEKDKEASTPVTVTIQMPGKPGPSTLSIPLYYLTNKKRFKEFLAQHKVVSDDGALKILADIQSQLSTLRQRV